MMGRHIAYAKYVLRHKWYVLQGARVVGCSLSRALLHDLTKLDPREWLPYAQCFYTPDGEKRFDETDDFQQAWLRHQHRNPHHWQHWVLVSDGGVTEALPMPDRYVREMVADWIGAGLAITGKLDVRGWYEKNGPHMKLHPVTRKRVQALLEMVQESA